MRLHFIPNVVICELFKSQILFQLNSNKEHFILTGSLQYGEIFCMLVVTKIGNNIMHFLTVKVVVTSEKRK